MAETPLTAVAGSVTQATHSRKASAPTVEVPPVTDDVEYLMPRVDSALRSRADRWASRKARRR